MALTQRQKVLLLTTGDSASTALSNDEIDAFIDIAGDTMGAASLACQAIAASEAKSSIIWKSGQLSIDKSKIPDFYLKLAKDYAKKVVPKEVFQHWSWDITQWGEDRTEYVGDDITRVADEFFDLGY